MASEVIEGPFKKPPEKKRWKRWAFRAFLVVFWAGLLGYIAVYWYLSMRAGNA